MPHVPGPTLASLGVLPETAFGTLPTFRFVGNHRLHLSER